MPKWIPKLIIKRVAKEGEKGPKSNLKNDKLEPKWSQMGTRECPRRGSEKQVEIRAHGSQMEPLLEPCGALLLYFVLKFFQGCVLIDVWSISL